MDDSKIIQLYFDRDESAIEATADKYGRYCHAVANNILNSAEDSEECVNDTYLKTWNTIPPKKPTVLRTFLAKITRNTAFDRYKRLTAEKRGGGQIEAVLDELEECLEGSGEPLVELERKELIAAINAFLSGLPKDKCAIFVRRYWYAESTADIAKRFSMSENNVSVNLNRLRKKLRSFLTERGFEL